MSIKRKALSVLQKSELLELGQEFGLEVRQRMSMPELVGVIAGSKRATVDKILPLFSRQRLKEVCEVLGLPVSAGNKAELVDRILGRSSEEPAEPENDDAPQLELIVPAPIAALAAAPVAAPAPAPVGASAPAVVPDPPQYPELDTLEAATPKLTRPVPPRQPRLVWHGWDRRELTGSVPSQVVEIVKPMRVQRRDSELPSMDAARRRESEPPSQIPNRLIWTNDNLVALRTLLDEKEATGGYRYRGKVDLVYIDPPFMVQSDFLAQNAIDIELNDEAGVQVKKEPSLVEILAYKDTWRQGLDSFLSMLRARLELLKDLLAPTGSIYVHLDWHAVHYVKVLMDEVFGYECFRNEVVWKRASARAGTNGINHVHDVLLGYGASPSSYHSAIKTPYDPAYIRSHYGQTDGARRWRTVPLNAPGLSAGPTGQAWRGVDPPRGRHWSHVPEDLDRFDAEGRIKWTKNGTPELIKYLEDDDGLQINSIWDDIAPVNPQALERLGYPTQKPTDLLERVILSSCPPEGLVLDCFNGSGTTSEAAERLGRRWIGIDNGKYAIHLARKRLIHLNGQKRPADKPSYDYVECDHCKNIERKERATKSLGTFDVRPFTVENMGVYQRAEAWQGFQTQKSQYRDEMIKVYGGVPVEGFKYLHGQKGDAWVHVGPLDGPVSSRQVWDIAREARQTDKRRVTVLSADFNTLSSDDVESMEEKLDGMHVSIRVIPAAALDEIRRRIEHQQRNPGEAYSSTAVPAFYAPLAIELDARVDGRLVKLQLKRCEVDVESFLESQKPSLKPVTERMTEAQRRKAQSELQRWEQRRKELDTWLRRATSWKSFVDFWAVDWSYGDKTGQDGKPIFETDWQSFRQKKGKSETDLTFTAERNYAEVGKFRLAARVTDVFGNDGIAAVEVDVG